MVCRLDRAGVPLGVIESIQLRASYEDNLAALALHKYVTTLEEVNTLNTHNNIVGVETVCTICCTKIQIGSATGYWICESCDVFSCDGCTDVNNHCKRCAEI